MTALALVLAVIGIPVAPALVLSFVKAGAPWNRRYWAE
jgi:hypothetical protein